MKYKIKKIWKNMNNAKEIIKELFFFFLPWLLSQNKPWQADHGLHHEAGLNARFPWLTIHMGILWFQWIKQYNLIKPQ